jgi:hypothetical protein
VATRSRTAWDLLQVIASCRLEPGMPSLKPFKDDVLRIAEMLAVNADDTAVLFPPCAAGLSGVEQG